MSLSYTDDLKNNLWNSPVIPKDSLTPDQQEKLKSSGEKMYNQMDFENLESLLIDNISYIQLQLRSGLHFSYLTDEEKELMCQVYGKGWESAYI